MKHCIRLAAEGDSGELLKIYSPYITDSAVSFETEVPTVGDFARRIKEIGSRYPFLVYLAGDELAGYAYASRHREREAYLYDVDASIYIGDRYHGSGVARALYTCLFHLLKELGYYTVYAGFTVPNEKSRKFHEKFGFTYVGTYRNTGYKLGKWHDVTWLEKPLKEYSIPPEPIKSIGELSPEYLEEIFHRAFSQNK